MKRLFVFGLIAAAFLAVPNVAIAGSDNAVLAFVSADIQDESDDPDVTVNESGIEPAVDVPAPEVDEEEQPWTARFLAPTVLALGVVGLVAATAVYGLRIRGRYRVVE